MERKNEQHKRKENGILIFMLQFPHFMLILFSPKKKFLPVATWYLLRFFFSHINFRWKKTNSVISPIFSTYKKKRGFNVKYKCITMQNYCHLPFFRLLETLFSSSEFVFLFFCFSFLLFLPIVVEMYLENLTNAKLCLMISFEMVWNQKCELIKYKIPFLHSLVVCMCARAFSVLMNIRSTYFFFEKSTKTESNGDFSKLQSYISTIKFSNIFNEISSNVTSYQKRTLILCSWERWSPKLWALILSAYHLNCDDLWEMDNSSHFHSSNF